MAETQTDAATLERLLEISSHLNSTLKLDELLGAGARLLRARGDDIEWDVLADPEGNEFCLFSPDGD